MGDQGREGVLRRMIRAIAGGAEEARHAAVQRTNAKYPDAYPPGYVERERGQRDVA